MLVYSALRDDEGKEDKGYGRVKRLTRSRREVPDIFACKYVLIPIHLGQHWCCAVINFHLRRIEYYDSLLSANSDCMTLLRGYLTMEHEYSSWLMQICWTLSTFTS